MGKKNRKERFRAMGELKFVQKYGVVLIIIHEGCNRGCEIAEQLKIMKEEGKDISFISQSYVSDILNHFSEPPLSYIKCKKITAERGNPKTWVLQPKGRIEVEKIIKETERMSDRAQVNDEPILQRMIPENIADDITRLISQFDSRPAFVLKKLKSMNTTEHAIYQHEGLMDKLVTWITKDNIDENLPRAIDLYCALWARAVYSHPGFAQDTAWLESAPFRQLWELSQLDSLSDAQRKLLRTEIKMVFKHYYTKDRPLNDDWMKGLIREILNNPDPGSFYSEILLYYANEKDRRTMVENLDAAWKDGKCEGVDNSRKEQLDDLLNHSKLINYRPC